jgi:hypothetical protein
MITKEVVDRIAKLVRDFYDDKLSLEELFKQAPELDWEEEFSRLLGLIERQPPKRGFFGVTEEHDAHRKAGFEELEALLEKYGH